MRILQLKFRGKKELKEYDEARATFIIFFLLVLLFINEFSPMLCT